LYITVHAVLPLLASVMVALPEPEPVQPPLVVIPTVQPEFAVAATVNVAALAAIAGAAVVTVMAWVARLAVIVLVFCGAAV